MDALELKTLRLELDKLSKQLLVSIRNDRRIEKRNGDRSVIETRRAIRKRQRNALAEKRANAIVEFLKLDPKTISDDTWIALCTICGGERLDDV